MTDPDESLTRRVVDELMPRVAGDLCAVIDELAVDELTWRFPDALTGGKAWEGKATVLRRMARVVDNFAAGSMRMRQGATLIDGATAAVEFHLDAESYNGVPYSNDYVFMVTCVGDRLASVNEYTDSKYVLDFLQAVEAREVAAQADRTNRAGA
ncbi:MAG: hypothetical protein PSX37_00045 [bacterium]|nr:hypothetical protein [bacterium]